MHNNECDANTGDNINSSIPAGYQYEFIYRPRETFFDFNNQFLSLFYDVLLFIVSIFGWKATN